MSSCPEVEGLKLLLSLDPQLACVAARGLGNCDSVIEICTGSVVGGGRRGLDGGETGEGGGGGGGGGGRERGGGTGGDGEVREWAVKMMTEVVSQCSETQLQKHCIQWRTLLQSALQSCTTARTLREVIICVSSLVRKAHSTGLRDFSTAHLPPLLSSLLRFRESLPCLQSVVLPGVAAIFHFYPTACKSLRSEVLQWGKDGLLNSDLSLSRESARLLVVTHQGPDHWTNILSSSLSVLSSSLLHLSHTISQTTPPAGDCTNLDLPTSEPQRSSNLLKLITSHSRLLSFLLLSPPSSLLHVPLLSLVDTVSSGLKINQDGVNATATDSVLLLSLLPIVHSSLLTLLSALVHSAQTQLFPLSSHIDAALLSQMEREGGVVWWQCVSGAICEWVRIRGGGGGGGGGKGDGFTVAVVQWLLKTCYSEDEGKREMGLRSLSLVIGHSSVSLPPQLYQEVWEVVMKTLTRSLSPSPDLLLAGVSLLCQCLRTNNSSSPSDISTTIKILQKFSLHDSSKVSEVSRQVLAQCTRLLHPMGPPWQSMIPPNTNPCNHSTNHTSLNTTMETQPSSVLLSSPRPPAGADFLSPSDPSGSEVPQQQQESRKRNREERGEREETAVSNSNGSQCHAVDQSENDKVPKKGGGEECAVIGNKRRQEDRAAGGGGGRGGGGGGGRGERGKGKRRSGGERGGWEEEGADVELVEREKCVAVDEEEEVGKDKPAIKRRRGNGGAVEPVSGGTNTERGKMRGNEEDEEEEEEEGGKVVEEDREGVEEGGRRNREKGEGAGGGGVGEEGDSDDSDVADILATFCSSPSNTTDSDLSS